MALLNSVVLQWFPRKAGPPHFNVTVWWLWAMVLVKRLKWRPPALWPNSKGEVLLQTIINFQGCSTAVEEIPNPETGEIVGRAFVIIDNDANTVYRCILPVDLAKLQGQRLMGIGSVSTASPGQMAQEVAKVNGHNHNGGSKS